MFFDGMLIISFPVKWRYSEAESGSTLKDGWCLFPSDASISEFYVVQLSQRQILSLRQVTFGSRLTPFIVSSFEIQAS